MYDFCRTGITWNVKLVDELFNFSVSLSGGTWAGANGQVGDAKKRQYAIGAQGIRESGEGGLAGDAGPCASDQLRGHRVGHTEAYVTEQHLM